MPLPWTEIRDKAIAFSRDWQDAESERAEAQTFWNKFFEVFGIHRRRVAVFEKQVDLSRAKRKLKGGRIDAFWKGVLLIEHKSADADLNRAFAQAADYFEGVAERVAFLFELYQKYTSLLPAQSKAQKAGRKRKSP